MNDEIDLHGMTVDEAIPALEAFLYKSYRQHYLRVYVIHGKGTGVLKLETRRYLDNCTIVESYNTAEGARGGEGTTEVWFTRL